MDNPKVSLFCFFRGEWEFLGSDYASVMNDIATGWMRCNFSVILCRSGVAHPTK